jgi:NTE family protein
MAAVGRRISRAYTASRRYLAANVQPQPGEPQPGGH